MGDKLEIFENETMKISVVDNEDGKFWFVARDICDDLGLTDVSKTLQRLDDDEKVLKKIFISGREREVWTINESGLYSLILTSNKPEAKKFKKWVTSEVLPAIRKKGSYSLTDSREKINAMIEMRVEEKLAGFIEVIEKTMGEIEEDERVERNEFFDKIMEGAKEGFEKKREYIFMPMEEFQKMVLRHEEEIAELKKSIKDGEAIRKDITQLKLKTNGINKKFEDLLNLNKKYKGEK